MKALLDGMLERKLTHTISEYNSLLEHQQEKGRMGLPGILKSFLFPSDFLDVLRQDNLSPLQSNRKPERAFRCDLGNLPPIKARLTDSSNYHPIKPDSRPVSPSSPKSGSRRGLLVGFTLNLLLRVIASVIDRCDSRDVFNFFERLRRISKITACFTNIDILSQRKCVNNKFHAYMAMQAYARSDRTQQQPDAQVLGTVLPILSGTQRLIQPPSVIKYRNDVAIFAGLGKVVGIAYSIHRNSVLESLRCMKKNSKSNS
jgi:hypothetical protein